MTDETRHAESPASEARRRHRRMRGLLAWYVRYDGQDVDGPFRTRAEAEENLRVYRKQRRTFRHRELFELRCEPK